jgi:ribosomal-protein-alanine N-acetyltransferase
MSVSILHEALQTARLRLRPLRDDDIEVFAAMHADPRMMKFLGPPLARAESEAALSRILTKTRKGGLGPWAVELHDREGLIGLVGLSRSELEVSFAPCVELVWRLAPECWSHGYATEAARASLDFAFKVLGLAEVLAWTTPSNVASRRVMEKVGMTRDSAEDFDHPRLPAGHPLRRHMLYRRRAARP